MAKRMLLLAAVGLLWLSWQCLQSFLERAPLPGRAAPRLEAGVERSRQPRAAAQTAEPVIGPVAGKVAGPRARTGERPAGPADSAAQMPLGAGAPGQLPLAGRVWLIVMDGLSGSDLVRFPGFAAHRGSVRRIELSTRQDVTPLDVMATIVLGADLAEVSAGGQALDASARGPGAGDSRGALVDSLVRAGDLCSRMEAAGVHTHLRGSRALARVVDKPRARAYGWESYDPDPALARSILMRIASDLRGGSTPQLGVIEVPMPPPPEIGAGGAATSGATVAPTSAPDPHTPASATPDPRARAPGITAPNARASGTAVGLSESADAALAALAATVPVAAARSRMAADDVAVLIVPARPEEGHLVAFALGSAVRPGPLVRGHLEDLGPTAAWLLAGPRPPLPAGRPLVELSVRGQDESLRALYNALLEERSVLVALGHTGGDAPALAEGGDEAGQIRRLIGSGKLEEARRLFVRAHARIAVRLHADAAQAQWGEETPGPAEGGESVATASEGRGAGAAEPAPVRRTADEILAAEAAAVARVARRGGVIAPRLRVAALVIGALGILLAFVFTPRPVALIGTVLWTAVGVAVLADLWPPDACIPDFTHALVDGPLLWRALAATGGVTLVALLVLGRRGAREMTFYLSWFDAVAGALALSVALIPLDARSASSVGAQTVLRFLGAMLAISPLVFAPGALINFLWNRRAP